MADPHAGRTMLITGASAGIGAALAREYASRGWNLILTARRTDRLEALKTEIEAGHDVSVDHVSADLMADGAVDEILADIAAKGLVIDGLINNAGYGHPGMFLDSSWEEHDLFNRLMVGVVVEATRKVLPGMVERGFGRTMHVASLAGHMPGSRGHTLYAAVKAYLVKFAQSLNLELDGTGVHVSALCPGFTITEFHDVNGTREGINQLPDYMKMSAEDCARLGADALEDNVDVFIPGKVNRTIARLGRFLPQSRVKKMMAERSAKFRNSGDDA
ncbi:SDR family NAD(P)-dependent oxidoreductase [Algimonas porphyrae]|uniref:Dehydrogenase n=1 Tax=Algimonas porphyrae TaxID=1128113 RepID=A0ABQ5V027_9PROT|nr:SDR family oxidoreductase [Algimonas porphyrae]GLQ20898.1 dehydrogenase [Algimonas porphyrae]